MEKLLSDKSKFVEVIFNPKHEVNKEVRRLLGMELTIKSCLDDLLNNNYLSKEDYMFLKPCGRKPVIINYVKFTSSILLQEMYHHFDRFYLQLVPQHMIFLYFFLKNAPLTSLLAWFTFVFFNEIRKQDPSLCTSSFDIQLLFTNNPLDETIDISYWLYISTWKENQGNVKVTL